MHVPALRAEPHWRDRIAICLGGAAVLSLFSLWPLLGNAAAYATLFLALSSTLIGWRASDWSPIPTSHWQWALGVGFAFLAAAFLLQPGRPSIPAIGDFAVFALAPLITRPLVRLARTRMTLAWLVAFCLLGAAIAAYVGLYGVSQGRQRASAPDLSPIHFADIAMIMGFMSLALTLQGRSSWRWLALAGPIFGLVASVAAGTRAAVLVGCALALVYGIFWMRSSPMRVGFKILIPFIMAGIVILAFYLASLAGYNRAFDALRAMWGTLSGDLSGDSSTAYRIEMFRAGWLAFLDSPVVGHGWHNQLSAAMPYLSEMAQRGYERQAWGYIHNDALSLAVAAGIPGLLAYCLFLLAPILAVMRRSSDEGRVTRIYLALTFSLGLFISGLTDVLFMVELPKFLLIFVSAALFYLRGQDEKIHD